MSRLDRLLSLIESGGTDAVRKAAAVQIGEIQKIHSSELHSLLAKVSQRLLYGKTWDTRVAASQAIEAILSNLPPWFPSSTPTSSSTTSCCVENKTCSLNEFNFEDALNPDMVLLGSGGREFQCGVVGVVPQKALLKENLGDFVDVDEIIQEEDLVEQQSHMKRQRHSGEISPQQQMVRKKQQTTTTTTTKTTNERAPSAPCSSPGLGNSSARQVAAAKLKARMAVSSTSISPVSFESQQQQQQAATKVVTTDQPQEESKIVLEVVKDDQLVCNGKWPLTCFCSLLVEMLTNQKWEIRHGAALGLRAVLKDHANGAAREEGDSLEKQNKANEMWLEDLAVRFLSVLCRDRFNDFVSDQTVAPVRETIAQALGALCKACSAQIVSQIFDILLRLHQNTEWEVRYSGLLGIKYVVALRTDMADILLPRIIQPLINALNDPDDDIRGASASVLLPVSKQLCTSKVIHPQIIETLNTSLWTTLLDLDDITSSTAPIMELLADLHSMSDSENLHSGELSSLVPRLLPYLHHFISSVRSSALRTLNRLLQTKGIEKQQQIQLIIGDVITNLFHVIVVDKITEKQAFETWSNLFQHSSIAIPIGFPKFPSWINCLRTPNILKLRAHPKFGKRASSELITENPNDFETLQLLNDKTCSEALVIGCNALGILANAALKEIRNDLFATLEFLLDYPSQLTTLIASLILDFAATTTTTLNSSNNNNNNHNNQQTIKLSPRLYAQLSRAITNNAIPNGEIDIHCIVAGSSAAAIIQWELPPKLNDIIHAILSSLKTIECPFQQRFAFSLAQLMVSTSKRQSCPNSKILAILATMLTSKPKEQQLENEQQQKQQLQLQVQSIENIGAQKTIQFLCSISKGQLFQSIPKLWELLENPLFSSQTPTTEDDIEKSLALFSVIFPVIDESLITQLLGLLPSMIKLVSHDSQTIQNRAISSTAIACDRCCSKSMVIIIEHLLPLLRPVSSTHEKCGAAIAVRAIVSSLDIKIVPYCAFFIGPLLSCMSDQSKNVREGVAFSFGSLVRLLPLEAASHKSSIDGMSEELITKRENERKFLQQLLDGKKLDNIKLPFGIKGELRRYQQEGINWLIFLRKYHLHGILCDDMGLGKTLQAMCAMAASSADESDEASKIRPSIVICPSTLVGHWMQEISKFISVDHLKPVTYSGSHKERASTISSLGPKSVLVVSYDILRNDYQQFQNTIFNYCVLDEGHMIKNPKTKLSQAVKSIKATSRLILTGTPVQNNVLELWSLFDFIIPGFLGTEREFNEKFSKPISQSRGSNCSQKDQEAGVHAMEALHKQVQPLLLRRMKEDVLQDLPPKIIQDCVVDLSPLQLKLYEDFAENKERILTSEGEALANVAQEESHSSTKTTSGMLQALQYLRKVCAHPALVLDESHPMYKEISKTYSSDDIHDIKQSAKLNALRDILDQCGIGSENGTNSNSNNTKSNGNSEQLQSQHRVLVFAQFKTLLDLVEKDLFQKHMPDVTYLRLDGSVPPNKRQEIVTRFNGDPTIDVLLLTTHVGGLGLSLTGADVVVFLEHDWNPTRDLQAMDRAHRIGQVKVVNVYRIITRGTIEEKIMGLQQFKTHLANTVISRESDSSLLSTVDTANLLDLFSLSSSSQQQAKAPATNEDISTTTGATSTETKGIGKKLSAMMKEIGELWDESEYSEEFDVSDFVKHMSSKK